MPRKPLLLPWLLCCLLLVSACSSGDPHGTAASPSSAGSAAGGGVTVPVTTAGATATTASWHVRMTSTPSARSGATLTIAPLGAAAPPLTATTKLRLGGEPTRFELVGAQIGANGATVTKQLGAPVPADQQGSLAYFDQTARAWVAVPTVVSADRSQLTAQTAHFSIWDDIYYGIGAGITKRADAPSCSTPTPSWVSDTTFLDDLNAPLQWCTGRDPKNPQWLVVKVVASRAYGFLMRPAVTPQWTHSSFLADAGAGDLITAGVDHTLRLPDTLQAMRGGVFLAPGTEIDFGFTEPQVRSLKTTELVSADPSITWMLAGSMYSAVSAVTGQDHAKLSYAYSLVAALQCARDLVKANSAIERSTALVSCLASNAGDFTGQAVKLAEKAGMDTSAATKAMPAVAAISLGVTAASVGAQIGEWLSDQALPPASRALSVSLKAVPHVRPSIAAVRPNCPPDCRAPASVVNAVARYVQAREDSVGVDQSDPFSWLTSITSVATAEWFASLQPNPNAQTCGCAEFNIAHDHNWVVRAQIENCIWDLEQGGPPTATHGAVDCSVTDTTIDRATGAPVPPQSLPSGYTHSGSQPTVLSVVQRNGAWLINYDRFQ